MRVKVDADKCVGSGLCVDICPEVFTLNGDAAIVKFESVPPRYEDACREASELCPTAAISVED
jgi:ferredoxin